MFINTLGGLGLFLLGMIIMTAGIREIAGSALRGYLVRFTRTPLTGAITGTCVTAILQSSSATTVAAVGFVAAGILGFSQALGIIFGANLGTTITGWMVALLGFKLKLGEIVLPLILLGAVLRLFGKGRLASGGYALAGFSLIFVGIGFMQDGMFELRETFSFEALPADSLGGRIRLLFVGLIFTIITQSSSAGVATTMTALNASLINFDQAMALVIGMDLGTTVTAAIATIGANLEARRTGFSHVVYNLFTACGALLLITPYIHVWHLLSPGGLATSPEIGLVLFHSTFNLVGIILVIPFARQFANFIVRLFPDNRRGMAKYFDSALLKDPVTALAVVQKYIPKEITTLCNNGMLVLQQPGKTKTDNLDNLSREVEDMVDFVELIHLDSGHKEEWIQLVYCIHIMDHMGRFLDRLFQLNKGDEILVKDDGLKLLRQEYTALFRDVSMLTKDNKWQAAASSCQETTEQLAIRGKELRDEYIRKISEGVCEIPEGTLVLDHLRYLKRMGHHISRILYYSELMLLREEPGTD